MMFYKLVFKTHQKKIHFNSIRTFQHCSTCTTKTHCENVKRCTYYDDNDDFEVNSTILYRKNYDFQNKSNISNNIDSKIFSSSNNNYLSSNSNLDVSDVSDISDVSFDSDD